MTRPATPLNPASNKTARKGWTDEDLITLRRMYGNHPVKEIAERIGHSFYSTERKAADLRLFKRNDLRVWTNADDEFLSRQYSEGKRPVEIGRYMGRTAKSVCQRLERIGIRRPKDTRPVGYEYSDPKTGLTRRKVADAPLSRTANWKRVDVIQWEEINGPVPDGYTLMIANKYLPRAPSNLRLIKKDELWPTLIGVHLPPEVQELAQLKRQIVREAKKLKGK
ncbi:hypothetical protein [Comamonas sp. B21-038]|uniref:hypothetical protein n=1 Tax=Comamonas sp. B21-038 TaxID=2918299 RepID=UPI001EFBD3C2|nr:hypothetical protein [Comamonas sp. B21-038]ULR90959.1 hypothetical protein MJ205_08975 [Comamonas sp. B21-038]